MRLWTPHLAARSLCAGTQGGLPRPSPPLAGGASGAGWGRGGWRVAVGAALAAGGVGVGLAAAGDDAG